MEKKTENKVRESTRAHNYGISAWEDKTGKSQIKAILDYIARICLGKKLNNIKENADIYLTHSFGGQNFKIGQSQLMVFLEDPWSSSHAGMWHPSESVHQGRNHMRQEARDKGNLTLCLATLS